MIFKKENNKKDDLDEMWKDKEFEIDDEEIKSYEKEITKGLSKDISTDTKEIQEIQSELKRISKELNKILKNREHLTKEIGEKSDDYIHLSDELREKWDEIKEKYKEILIYEKKISRLKENKNLSLLDETKKFYDIKILELKIHHMFNKELKSKYIEAGEILYLIAKDDNEKIDNKNLLNLIKQVEEYDKQIEDISQKSSTLKEKINKLPQKNKYKEIADEKISEITKKFEEIINNPNISEDEKIKKIIRWTSLTCGIIAVQPIPFADIWILSPIQITMIMWIGKVMGFKLDERGIRSFLAAGGIVFAGGIAAQNLIISLYKLGLPFAGGLFTIPLVGSATLAIGYGAKWYLQGIKADFESIKKEVNDIRKEHDECDKKILKLENEKINLIEEKKEIQFELSKIQEELTKEKSDKLQLIKREKELRDELKQAERKLSEVDNEISELTEKNKKLSELLNISEKRAEEFRNKLKRFGMEPEEVIALKEEVRREKEYDKICKEITIQAAKKRIEIKKDYIGASSVAQTLFERAVNELYTKRITERKIMSGEQNKIQIKIDELSKQKIIDNRWEEIFHQTRILRNKIVHPNNSKGLLSSDKVKKFVENVEKIIEYVEKTHGLKI